MAPRCFRQALGVLKNVIGRQALAAGVADAGCIRESKRRETSAELVDRRNTNCLCKIAYMAGVVNKLNIFIAVISHARLVDHGRGENVGPRYDSAACGVNIGSQGVHWFGVQLRKVALGNREMSAQRVRV